MVTKPTTPKAPKAVKKPAAAKAAPKKVAAEKPAHEAHAENHHAPKAHEAKGRYIFATGRRKTAIANVRLFEGTGENVVNKKPLEKYFGYSFFLEEIGKPLETTGLAGKHYFVAHLNGGGPHAQATALRHGISGALGKISPEIRKVLKKNGFLTRDDRKKERKKPGLKRARRSPQWAKR
jgi:small subunit ribosomal protein S9